MSQRLLDALTLRCRILAEPQVRQLLGVKGQQCRRVLKQLEEDGLAEQHRVWGVWPPAEVMAPLFSWRPGEPEAGDGVPAVEAAIRRGIGRWEGRPPRVLPVWSATRRAAKVTGGSARMSRAGECSHDLLLSQAYLAEQSADWLKEDCFGRLHPVARRLQADAVRGDRVIEIIGISYKLNDVVRFCEACRIANAPFELW